MEFAASVAVEPGVQSGKLTCPSCEAQHPAKARYCCYDGTQLAGDDVGGTTQPMEKESVGQVIGAYRILERLGEGGMSQVFLARHTRLNRRVALKRLRPEFAQDPRAVARFFDEARIVNEIKHESVVEIIDCVDTDSDTFCVMEHLEGVDLRTLLARVRTLPLRRCLEIGAQISDAMAAVHSKGLIHRDLKPSNIFLAQSHGREKVKLLDFGIARPIDQAKSGEDEMLLGSPAYVSPEYACGRTLDHRNDVYALGVVLYEMVAGERPFDATTPQALLRQHLTVSPLPPSAARCATRNVPPELDQLILQCLRKNPQGRPQQMRAVERRLRTIAARQGIALSHSQKPTRFRGSALRWLAGTALAVVLALGPFWVTITEPGLVEPTPVEVSLDSPLHRVWAWQDGTPVSVNEPLAMSLDPHAEPVTLEVALEGSSAVPARVRFRMRLVTESAGGEPEARGIGGGANVD